MLNWTLRATAVLAIAAAIATPIAVHAPAPAPVAAAPTAAVIVTGPDAAGGELIADMRGEVRAGHSVAF